MSRTGIQELNNMLDPLLSHQFDLFFTNMPIGNSRKLATQIQTSAIPGYSNETVIVRLHGVERHYAGAGKYTHDLPCTFVESRDMVIRDSMLAWLEYIRNVRNTTGSYAADYCGIGDLVLYDDRNNAIRTVRLQDIYPERIDDFAVSGDQGSDKVVWNANFKYFYFTDLS